MSLLQRRRAYHRLLWGSVGRVEATSAVLVVEGGWGAEKEVSANRITDEEDARQPIATKIITTQAKPGQRSVASCTSLAENKKNGPASRFVRCQVAFRCTWQSSPNQLEATPQLHFFCSKQICAAGSKRDRYGRLFPSRAAQGMSGLGARQTETTTATEVATGEVQIGAAISRRRHLR
ncbi:hypothetical protein L916_15844 [Phytophthora nicotianae]|uniref:Uncharacterized protein n=1 Tax=Phytophthora nicotianae TaxID=4792 RepID=W2IAV0_PHYNI|nr:hypothetical protein L916_15844 [Phytophthora nicotianae]